MSQTNSADRGVKHDQHLGEWGSLFDSSGKTRNQDSKLKVRDRRTQHARTKVATRREFQHDGTGHAKPSSSV